MVATGSVAAVKVPELARKLADFAEAVLAVFDGAKLWVFHGI